MQSARIGNCGVNINAWSIMVISRKHLEFYIKSDLMMNRGYFKSPIKKRLLHLVSPDYIVEFLKAMRKVQYYSYNRNELCWGGDFAFNLQTEIFQVVSEVRFQYRV